MKSVKADNVTNFIKDEVVSFSDIEVYTEDDSEVDSVLGNIDTMAKILSESKTLYCTSLWSRHWKKSDAFGYVKNKKADVKFYIEYKDMTKNYYIIHQAPPNEQVSH